MVTKKHNYDKKVVWRYGFALAVIIAGLLLSFFDVGNEFLGFSSVGMWLTYVGFIMVAVITLQSFFKKKRVVDERMMFVATKASRITFLGIILFSFIIMVFDGIRAITVPYSYFMSYFLSGMVLLYLVSYNVLLKLN